MRNLPIILGIAGVLFFAGCSEELNEAKAKAVNAGKAAGAVVSEKAEMVKEGAIEAGKSAVNVAEEAKGEIVKKF
jgi:hypothetical protein